MKTDKKNRSVDIKKVKALNLAGWSNERIAEEMEITSEKVEEIMRNCEEKPSKEQEDIKRDYPQSESLIILASTELREIYEKAATIGAREALKTFEQERKKEYSGRADRRLRNTKLLLRNYHMLKEHAKNSVFGRTQMEESALDILESMMSIYDNEVIIESIKRSATRTAVIVSHIETMFDLYAVYCNKALNRDIEMRRYAVIWDMYMADDILSIKEVAEKHHMSRDNVYKDLRIATERLTALIFGVDGLNIH